MHFKMLSHSSAFQTPFLIRARPNVFLSPARRPLSGLPIRSRFKSPKMTIAPVPASTVLLLAQLSSIGVALCVGSHADFVKSLILGSPIPTQHNHHQNSILPPSSSSSSSSPEEDPVIAAAHAVIEHKPIQTHFEPITPGDQETFSVDNHGHVSFTLQHPDALQPKKIDIYRDTPLRYLGYANEVGESFRPLTGNNIVYLSYVLAILYVLADSMSKAFSARNDILLARGTLIYKSLDGAETDSVQVSTLASALLSLGLTHAQVNLWKSHIHSHQNTISCHLFLDQLDQNIIPSSVIDQIVGGTEDSQAVTNEVAAFIDAFTWQMLASVIFPGFCINRLVYLAQLIMSNLNPFSDNSLTYWTTFVADFGPTIFGLCCIPLIIHPLDHLADLVLDVSLRRLLYDPKQKV